MSLTNTASRYGSVSQTLHWLTVAMVIVLLVSGKVTHIEADEPGNVPFLWHGSLGVLILLLRSRVSCGHLPALPPVCPAPWPPRPGFPLEPCTPPSMACC